jgi:hypothetical protein
MTREQVQARIALTRIQRKNRSQNTEEILEMLKNDFGTTLQSDGNMVNLLAPNFMMSTKRQMMAQLYPGDPKIRCIPRMRGFEERATAVETLLEYYWRELDLAKTMRRVVEDTLIYGYGVAKVGMGSLETSIDESMDEEEEASLAAQENESMLGGESQEVIENDAHEIHLQEHMKLQQTPAILEDENAAQIMEALSDHIAAHEVFMENPVPSFPTSAGAGPNYDWPFVESVGPDVYWDPMVTDPRTSAYVIHCIKKRLKDVKRDPLYKNTSNLSPDSYDNEEFDAYKISTGVGEDQSTYIPEELGTITLYEIWDAESRSVSTWVESEEDPIRSPDEGAWPSFIEGYPFRWLTFTDMPGEVHGPSIMEYLRWPQKFLMRIYSELATHSDRSGIKYEVDENRLGQRETQDSVENKLADPTSGVAIFVQERGAITPVQPAMVDPTKMQLIGLLQTVIYENSGVTTEMRGVAASETATQASIMASSANMLAVDSIGRVSKNQQDIAQDLVGILREYGPENQVLRVVMPGGEMGWMNYSKNDVQAEWQVLVEMPSPAQSDRDLQQFLNMFHMFSPHMDTIGRKQAMMDGMRLFGIQNPELYAIEMPADLAALIQLENQGMSQGTPAQAYPGQEHQKHIEGHSTAMQQWNQSLQQMIQGVVQQNPALQQNPEALRAVQQQIMESPEGGQIGNAVQLAQQHIQQHEELAQNAGVPQQGGEQSSRRRQAVPYPVGNKGRTESILSNQEQGT